MFAPISFTKKGRHFLWFVNGFLKTSTTRRDADLDAEGELGETLEVAVLAAVLVDACEDPAAFQMGRRGQRLAALGVAFGPLVAQTAAQPARPGRRQPVQYGLRPIVASLDRHLPTKGNFKKNRFICPLKSLSLCGYCVS